MERHDEALADFTRAIELDPRNAWAIIGRGKTYRLTGALRRGPGRLHPRHRTRPRQRLGHHQPRQDLPADGALRRGPGRLHPRHRTRPRHAWAIASRGETYRAMGRYDEALADLTRADRTRPPQRLGHRQPRSRPTGRWGATTRPWPTSAAPSNSTPATPGPSPAAARPTGDGALRRGPGRPQPRHRTRPRLAPGPSATAA